MSTILDNWLWDAVSTNWLIFVLTCALILGFWFGLITFTGDWFGHAPATAMLGYGTGTGVGVGGIRLL